MNDKILACINRYNLVAQGDELVVGVSGGADSVSLLHYLHIMRQELGIGLTAVHINHNLRGDESARDADFVRNLCAGYNVPAEIVSLDIAVLAKAAGQSVETYAREARYRVFDEKANAMERAGHSVKIVTAHTLNDSAETQLINFTRGTGPSGLTGIPTVRGRVIRPLITCTRQDVEQYCARWGLDYVTDSSNLSDRYTRNKLRHHVVPILEEINPAFLDASARLSEILRADQAYLDGKADILFKALTPESGALDARRLAALPDALSTRVLVRLLEQYHIPCDYARIRALLDTGISGGAVQLSERYTFKSEHGRIALVEAETPAPYFEEEIDLSTMPKSISFSLISGKTIKLIQSERKEFENNNKYEKKVLKNLMDCDRIRGTLKLRQRLPGDYIVLWGRGCTKSMRKLYNEAKIPVAQRS
ncbi:MAG: tRNA lysidine(34) synthetase TilS, partial [Oscillospiraceae bacterium]|nr:tRNA lysidine(34) synthetase TilS [Oscillospiraceae bacterium]